jgi:hypothetical protein
MWAEQTRTDVRGSIMKISRLWAGKVFCVYMRWLLVSRVQVIEPSPDAQAESRVVDGKYVTRAKSAVWVGAWFRC